MSSTTEGTNLPTDTTEECYEDLLGEEEDVIEEEELQLNSEDFISHPFLNENCTVPYNILELDYSYGYDCLKLFNLVAPDEETLVFIGGNLIHFFDVKTGNLKFRRSYLGGGLAHISVNPNSQYHHLTIAENGDSPPIIIYEWPTLEIVGVLKEGAAKRYSHINYSPDGEMLVSQSYGPDFLITVWNWKKWRRSPIILRTKSHVHDVYRCMFSPYVPGQITTGGAGHIKFWKMAQTFTGLKLQGELGRFGKTEISDIIGVFPMPDEKVISGSDWGNLLVWEAGLIKIEVMRTLRRKCHNGYVLQLEYIRPSGEIWSISHDGWIRAWEYRIIDEADPPDDDRVVQMVPSYEREIPDVKLHSICKKRLHNPNDMFYYVQDANGGIWHIDMNLSNDFEEPQRLKTCHAGKIVDMAASPWGPYLVTLGEDGRIFMYNYIERTLLFHYKFPALGCVLIWFPLQLDTTGTTLLAAFDDGVIRQFIITSQPQYSIKIISVLFSQYKSLKPHTKRITGMTLNKQLTLCVTGSIDATIFIFMIYKQVTENISLIPIGYVNVGAIPSCFTWKPDTETVLLVGCAHGEMFEYDLPNHPVPYTKISYFLHTVKPIKQRFTTCKAQIRRDLHISRIEKKKQEKIDRKKAEIAKIRADGLEVDEELYLQDSEDDEELEALYIPDIPNGIIFMKYTEDDTIWLSMTGYDAGYIYEYRMDQKEKEPLKSTMVYDGDDIELDGYIYSPDENFFIICMRNGAIRIIKRNLEDFRDLSDYWQLTMHDNFNGKITKMCFSYDYRYFFSCGEDGNIFSYIYNFKVQARRPTKRHYSLSGTVKGITVDLNYESLSLEETMLKAEDDKQMRLANEHKRKVRLRLKELTGRLTVVLDRNCKLPISQRYTLKSFIIDDRIMNNLESILDAKVALEKRKLAYDVGKSTIALSKLRKHYTDILDMYPFTVKAVRTNSEVSILIARALEDKFFKALENVRKRAQDEKLKGREYHLFMYMSRVLQQLHTFSLHATEEQLELDRCKRSKINVEERKPMRKGLTRGTIQERRKQSAELEPFLVGLSPSTIAFKLGSKLNRMLAKYRARNRRKETRQEEWNAHNAKKPVQGQNHPDDVLALEKASATIGDFKLKSNPKYRVPKDKQETTIIKYLQLLDARYKACQDMVHKFNSLVYNIRENKVKMIEKLKSLTSELEIIHKELPDCYKLQPPPIPVIAPGDFPERDILVKLTVESDFKDYMKKQQAPKRKPTPDTCTKEDYEKLVLGLGELPVVSGNCREMIIQITKESNIKYSPFNKKIPDVNDNAETVWEKELKHRRLLKLIHDQNAIIEEMNNMIDEFDKEVERISKHRFLVQRDLFFLELHILVLNQELVIVKDFEVVEHALTEVANNKWNEMMDMRDDMKRIELDIEGHNFEIDGCLEQIKVIQQTFITAAKDNKFWDFLRRIFKKKYRPPKLATDDSESSSCSSSSSSSSEEDDAGSVDSRDIGPIRLDESICPKGCDTEIYNYTFTLRNRRHDVEKLIKEKQNAISQCKKDMDQAAKRVRLCDEANKHAQDELEEYLTLKQQKLNEINCLVTLNLSQMKHVNPDGISVAKLSDTLVFNKHVLDDLYKRVREIQIETLEERNKHRKNKLHLHRMSIDCNHMNKRIIEIKKDIKQRMILKFGSPVKVDDLEESILKKTVLSLRISMLNLRKVYDKEIEELRKQYGEKQIELKNIIRENTARLEILTALNKEKASLSKILFFSSKAKEKQKTQEEYFISDVDKLEAISKSQQDQIQMLKSEIKMMGIKSLPPKMVEHATVETQKPEIILEGDFASLDEVYNPENYIQVKETKFKEEDLKSNDEEIIICIHELMKEVIDDATLNNQTDEGILVKTFTEIINQVPKSYLQNKTTVEYFTTLLKGKISNISSVEQKSVTSKVSQITNRKEDEIKGIISNILTNISVNEVTKD